MKNRLLLWSLIMTGIVAGCGNEPFDACGLGTETVQGLWRVRATEVNGTCGPMPDQVVGVGAAGTRSDDDCEYELANLSADMCELLMDYSCTSSDGSVTHVIGKLQHVADNSLSGTVNVTLYLPGDTCRSTYIWDWTKL